LLSFLSDLSLFFESLLSDILLDFLSDLLFSVSENIRCRFGSGLVFSFDFEGSTSSTLSLLLTLLSVSAGGGLVLMT
jgi:hypothetical protein